MTDTKEKPAENLQETTASLLALFDERKPIQKDGSFSLDAVKETALSMADLVIEDKTALAVFKEWMESHEFWTSPASTRFHGNTKGGLAAHSLMVTVQALRFAPAFAENFALSKRSDSFPFSAEDVFVAAFAHDFCKAGSYMTESRRTKDYNGNWRYEPFYKTKAELRNLGHGNESVLLLLESSPAVPDPEIIVADGRRYFRFKPEEEAAAEVRFADKVGSFIFQPSKALRKAGAFRLLSARFNLAKLAPSSHLYTSDAPVEGFPGKTFEVEEVLGWSKDAQRQLQHRKQAGNGFFHHLDLLLIRG